MAILSDEQLDVLAPRLQAVVRQLDAEGLVEGVASLDRTADEQARAMAVNEARAPGFIAATYADSDEKAACLAAIEALTTPKDAAAIETALLGAFAQPGFDMRRLTWHVLNAQGKLEAVDLLPVGESKLSARATQLVAAQRVNGADPRSNVLTREGGLPKCHLQVA